jgi:hypothetical protein
MEAYEYYDEIISLGLDCQIKSYMKKHSLWTGHDFVFDDLVSVELGSVINLIETRFVNFFSVSEVKQEKNFSDNYSDIFQLTKKQKRRREQAEKILVRDETTNIISVHDFKGGLSEKTYDKFIINKRSQISRLLNTIDKANSILFIRVNRDDEKLEDIIRLYNVLQRYRKEKAFKLYVFQRTNFLKTWCHSNLRLFFDGPWVWRGRGGFQGNVQLWNDIFRFVVVSNPIHPTWK